MTLRRGRNPDEPSPFQTDAECRTPGDRCRIGTCGCQEYGIEPAAARVAGPRRVGLAWLAGGGLGRNGRLAALPTPQLKAVAAKRALHRNSNGSPRLRSCTASRLHLRWPKRFTATSLLRRDWIYPPQDKLLHRISSASPQLQCFAATVFLRRDSRDSPQLRCCAAR